MFLQFSRTAYLGLVCFVRHHNFFKKIFIYFIILYCVSQFVLCYFHFNIEYISGGGQGKKRGRVSMLLDPLHWFIFFIVSDYNGMHCLRECIDDFHSFVNISACMDSMLLCWCFSIIMLAFLYDWFLFKIQHALSAHYLLDYMIVFINQKIGHVLYTRTLI